MLNVVKSSFFYLLVFFWYLVYSLSKASKSLGGAGLSFSIPYNPILRILRNDFERFVDFTMNQIEEHSTEIRTLI